MEEERVGGEDPECLAWPKDPMDVHDLSVSI